MTTLGRKVQTEARRARVADLYLTGVTQTAISQELQVGQATVSRDLKAIRAQWVESALVSFDKVKARELARIDRLEREAWRAWEESRGENVTRTEKEKSNGETERIEKIKQLNGDPRYLERVQWCIEQRLKIWGVYEQPDIAGLNISVTLKGEDQ